tara:strand:- start:535 stop:1200 length:666 start_codon:yes stop_codon:yes gene_type:complete
MNSLKISLYASLIAQFITTVISFYGFTVNLDKGDEILRTVLKLETLVQIIEGIFYGLVFYFFNQINLETLAALRYSDWILTTPTMLLSTIVFMSYLNKKVTDLRTFIKDNWKVVKRIMYGNLLMLLSGLLGEFNIITKEMATIVGFVFFGDVFYTIYKNFTNNNATNIGLFLFTFIAWSFYGVAYLFDDNSKNIAYNLLDVVAKNFYGLFLLYQIHLRKKL